MLDGQTRLRVGRFSRLRSPALARSGLLVLLVALLAACAGSGAREGEGGALADLGAEVDPFIGTGGHGHCHPAATLPFGMVQLGPDTRTEGWDACSCYHDDDRSLLGFSHTHLSGTGCADYGDLLIVPRAAPSESGPIPFAKEGESASPGHYGVALGNGVVVDLTATARVGFHRYRYPAGVAPRIQLDLRHRDHVLASSIEVDEKGRATVLGERRSSSWARDQRLYFAIRFSRPFATFIGDDLAAEFRFEAADDPLLIKVGLSATGKEAALRNLELELPDWDFAAARARARAVWNEALGRIEIAGGSRRERRIFYTALYHTMVAPNLWSDVDGRYRGLDGEVHEARGHDVYTVFSLWDTFRAAHPLYSIIEQQRSRDFLGTFLAHYQDGGRLPVWELAANETDCMIGYHAVPVILDAFAAGLIDPDSPLAQGLYEAAKGFAMLDQRGLDAYKVLGFIPSEHDESSVSKTLEYAYDDWCIAELAGRLGRAGDREVYLRRAQAYENLFDPETGFMRPRRGQVWKKPFDPREVDFNYTEANSWQYSFFVPHDVEGLVRLLGGREAFAARLDALFAAPSETTGREQSDITGLIGQYAHGNEPSHHMAYLYDHAGRPWQTQERVRQILDELYDDRPDGYCGNEDCGQMSAWYVLSALGFYPVCPGSGIYELGSPLFPRATLHLENGQGLVIRAEGASKVNRYVQGVEVDGEPWNRSFIPYDLVRRQGEIRFAMGATANRLWGVAEGDRPRHAIDEARILPAPYVVTPGLSFQGSLEFGLAALEPAARIHFTLDGTRPTHESPVYRQPIRITAPTTLQAFASLDGRPDSAVISTRFHQIDNDWSIRLDGHYSNQYTGDGDRALIDGLRGSTAWRTGSWQGYLEDLDLTVDFGAVKRVRRVALSCLQDTRSWIWLPESIRFFVSVDGREFHEVGVIEPDAQRRERERRIETPGVDLEGETCRYLRVLARPRRPDNARYPGLGGTAWIFADELLIDFDDRP